MESAEGMDRDFKSKWLVKSGWAGEGERGSKRGTERKLDEERQTLYRKRCTDSVCVWERQVVRGRERDF